MGQPDNPVKPVPLLSPPDKSTLNSHPGDGQSTLAPLAPADRCTSPLFPAGGGDRKRERTKSSEAVSSTGHLLQPRPTLSLPQSCTGLHPTQQRTGSDGRTTRSFPTSLLPRAWHGRAGTSWGSQRCRSRAAELLLQGKGEWSPPGSGRSRSGECRELDGHCLGLHPTETSPPVSP